MISGTLMWILIAFYIILACVAGYEDKIPLSLYWAGSALLTVGVALMNRP